MDNKTYISRFKQVVDSNPSGFTINPITLNPISHKKGFCVALTNNKEEDVNKSILNIIKIKNKFFRRVFLYYGGWKDNKEYYIDLTFITQDKDKALAMAKTFNQKAIFNLSTHESIMVEVLQ